MSKKTRANSGVDDRERSLYHLELLKRQHVHGVDVAEEVGQVLPSKVHHILPATGTQKHERGWGGVEGAQTLQQEPVSS